MKANILIPWCMALAVLSACAEPLQPEDMQIRGKVTRAVESGEEGAVVDFAAIVPGSWDRLHVFQPYSTLREMDERLGFHWPTAESTNIAVREHVYVLVFTEGKKVVAWIALARTSAEFPNDVPASGYAATSARFAVRSDESGRRRLVPETR